MATYRIAFHYEFADADGNLGSMVIHAPAADNNMLSDLATVSANIGTPLQALTNAKVVGRSFTVQLDKAQGLGTDAQYPGIEDKAALTFTNAFGSKMTLRIPAPKDAIFLPPPSDDVVNAANALVIAFHTAITANINDAAGNPLNLLTSGTRSVGKFPKLQPRRTAVA